MRKPRSIIGAYSLLLAVTCAIGSLPALSQSSEPPERPKRLEDPGQYYRQPGTMHGKTVVLPIGTTFEGRIDQTISSTHSRAGQRFFLTVDSPVLMNGSDVVIPAGSQVIGEVVEATPANKVFRQKWQPKIKIHGKLRIQISGLKTPDGLTYPMVGNLAGEVIGDARFTSRTPIGTSVGYTGSAASFETVSPNRITDDWRKGHYHSGGKPGVLRRKDMLADEVMGAGADGYRPDKNIIRSLVLDHRDYYVYKGSPLTIRLGAPFKIGIATPGMGGNLGRVRDEPMEDTLPPASARMPAPGGYPDNAPAGSGMDAPSAPPPPPLVQQPVQGPVRRPDLNDSF